jgi:hypothetical protein
MRYVGSGRIAINGRALEPLVLTFAPGGALEAVSNLAVG